MPNQSPPYRKTKIVNNPPPSCEKCKHKKCLEKDPPSPCDTVERWISQDCYTPSGSTIQLGNRMSSVSSFEFVDIMSIHQGMVTGPDDSVIEEAKRKVESLKLDKFAMEFIELFYYQGMRLSEVAAALNISDQAANHRHKKTKEKISNRLKRLEICKKINKFSIPDRVKREIAIQYYCELNNPRQIKRDTGFSVSYIFKILGQIQNVVE